MILVAAPAIGGSCRKYNFCRDKHTFVATKDVFCNIVATKLSVDKVMFVVTILLLLRQKFCQTRV